MRRESARVDRPARKNGDPAMACAYGIIETTYLRIIPHDNTYTIALMDIINIPKDAGGTRCSFKCLSVSIPLVLEN